jgi:hypothetical protein
MEILQLPRCKSSLNDGFFPNDFFFTASTSHNPMGFHGPLQGELYVFMIMLHVNAVQFVAIVTRNWVITMINLTLREFLDAMNTTVVNMGSTAA